MRKHVPLAFWRMKLFGKDDWANHAAEAHKVPVAHTLVDLKTPPETPDITWAGHASFIIRAGGKIILTDPLFSDRASPFSFAGPKRLTPKPYDLADLPGIDYVLISHNHYDHLDRATIRRLGSRPRYLVPLGLKAWFTARGIAPDRVEELDWWKTARHDDARFTATPAQHWSVRGFSDRNRSLWCGWHIALGGVEIWFCGDTGYNPVQFREIGARLGNIDLALIPIGAYAPRWFMKVQHVNVDEAIMIHREVGAKRALAMHWGTFQLTAEPIDEPKQLLDAAARDGRLEPGEFVTMALGETQPVRREDAQ